MVDLGAASGRPEAESDSAESSSVPDDAPPSYTDEFGRSKVIGHAERKGVAAERARDDASNSAESREVEGVDDEGKVTREGNGEAEDHEEEDDIPRQISPSRWRRLFTIIFVLSLVWGLFALHGAKEKKGKTIYADRYSKEFKYRPAASPIITSKLKDGTTIVHGAAPTVRAAEQGSTPTTAGSGSGKRKSKAKSPKNSNSKPKRGKSSKSKSSR